MLSMMKFGLNRFTYELYHLKFLISIFSFDTYNWSFLLAFLQWTLKSFFMLSIRNYPGTLEKYPRDLLSSSTLSDFKRKHWRHWKRPLTTNHLFLKKENNGKANLLSVNPQLGDGDVRDIVKSNLVLYFSPGSLFLRRFMGLFGWWDTIS